MGRRREGKCDTVTMASTLSDNSKQLMFRGVRGNVGAACWALAEMSGWPQGHSSGANWSTVISAALQSVSHLFRERRSYSGVGDLNHLKTEEWEPISPPTWFHNVHNQVVLQVIPPERMPRPIVPSFAIRDADEAASNADRGASSSRTSVVRTTGRPKAGTQRTACMQPGEQYSMGDVAGTERQVRRNLGGDGRKSREKGGSHKSPPTLALKVSKPPKKFFEASATSQVVCRRAHKRSAQQYW